MTERKFRRVGVFKCGNIASSPLFELLLDELADRQDLETRTVTTGAKMRLEDVEEALPRLLDFKPDLLVFISPNVSMPGPTRARENLMKTGLPCVVVSDGPAKRVRAELEKQGLGYIIVTGDPLIGARKEFLDHTEMAVFNSNMMKVLAIVGVYRIVGREIDRLIYAIKKGTEVALPNLVVDLDYIRDNSDFRNPYAKAKAMAAYGLAEKIAEINAKACFAERESSKYILLAASSHEIAQTSAHLAEEAREIEKYNDTLMRRPHAKDGRSKAKTELMNKPVLDEFYRE